MSPHQLRRVIVLSALATSASCGSDNPVGPPVVISTVTITSARPTLTAIGDSATLAVSLADAKGASVQDAPVAWQSSATTVATIEKGIVVARGNGTALISATAGSATDTATVIVQQKPARLSVVTRPGTQLQGHVMEAIDVEVTDARGVRLAIPSPPIQLTISSGTLTGTTSRASADGVARFDDLVASAPSRAAQLTAVLGDLRASSVFFPIQLALASVSAGGVHTCGLAADGTAYCWGYEGRTGDGGSTARNVPVRVSGTGRYHALDAGSSTTWTFDAAGDLATWGAVPTAFASAVKFASVSASWFTCGVTATQDPYCWGTGTIYFGNDSLPNGTVVDAPTVAMGGRKVLSIAPGMAHTCVIAAADSTAWCAGNNPNGEVGDGSTSFASLAVPVAGGLKFRTLSLGNEFTCGITISDDTYCWGRNGNGQLGDPGETGANSPLPRLVTGGLHFRTISTGGTATCGLTADGTAYCWGSNAYGLLGQSTLNAPPSAAPLAVSGGLKFSSISVGGFHACGIATTGVTYCWGDWSNGATGTGSANTNTGPVPIAIPES